MRASTCTSARGASWCRSLAIFVTVLAFNLLGDGLRRALDARLVTVEGGRLMAVLEARDLTSRFGGVEVLRDVSFTLARGRVLGLVGESGAGKSMIGRVIARILPRRLHGQPAAASRSTARICRPSATTNAARLLGDRIAFIPQEPLTALNPVLTIGPQFDEHLDRLGVARRRAARPRCRRAGRRAAPRSRPRCWRYPLELSGGMCQRVLIAMAFASEPALVVADEPTTALDVMTQAHIVRLIRSMQRDHGTALLFITHDLRLAAHVCDDILVLYAGDIVEHGPARGGVPMPRAIPIRARCRPRTRRWAASVRTLVTLPDQMPGIGALRSASRLPLRAALPGRRPRLRERRPRPAGDRARTRGALLRWLPGGRCPRHRGRAAPVARRRRRATSC